MNARIQFLVQGNKNNKVPATLAFVGFVAFIVFGTLAFATMINGEAVDLTKVILWPALFWFAAVAHFVARPFVNGHYAKAGK